MPCAVPRSLGSRNRVLALLGPHEYDAIAGELVPVVLDHKAFLFHRDQPSAYVYFPTTAVVCLLTVMADGKAVGAASVGPEGVVGMHVALESPVAIHDAVVAVGGEALRLPARFFREELRRDGLKHVVNRYLHAFMLQVTQIAACNRLHALRQRACAWLLTLHDRVEGNTFPLTQEFFATILGARRAGIVELAQELQTRGLIDYRRGEVRILNRRGLEDSACECYGVIAEQGKRLLG